MLDFSQEQEQENREYGPVPAGSVVVLRMEVEKPYYPAPHDPMVSQAKSGLLQLRCKFTVAEGKYRDVYFIQNITLPSAMQTITLTDKQRTGANIGGAQFKAILQSLRQPEKVPNWEWFNGRVFPARLKISKNPREYEGRQYWQNEIARIITPEFKEYTQIQKMPKGARELINEKGDTAGSGAKTASAAPADDFQPPWDDAADGFGSGRGPAPGEHGDAHPNWEEDMPW